MAYPLFGEYDLIEEERIIIRESSSEGSREGVVRDTVRDIMDINSRLNLKDSNGGDELFSWASAVKSTFIGRGADVTPEEEIGMFLEKTGEVSVTRKRKRSWQQDLFNGSGNKIVAKVGHQIKMDDLMDERDHRKVIAHTTQQKKINGGGDAAMGGTDSTGSSHLSSNWPVNDLDIDLGADLANNAYMNDALLSLPSLTFKQEAPSPTGGAAGGSPPRRAPWPRRDDQGARNIQINENMPMESNGACDVQNQNMNTQGPLVCSPHSTYEAYTQSGGQKNTVTSTESSYHDDFRFQYVLAAATSIATKTNEETLTYLNQGQSYEIKLKKLGDLSHYKGKILKSIVKICFHERRLQYMEREQMALWHSERPGERIVEVDVPLSYGLVQVSQPHNPMLLNCVEVLWDPTKDAGIYIKVNCISTEFTAKKHGGEKGVPFRVQVETFLPAPGEDHRLHAAACQIKVFKLKGADRKHKQDREKVQRQPRAEQDKYQASCDCTVLSTIPSDALLPPPSLLASPTSYSPELCVPGAGGNNSGLVLGQKQLGSPANAALAHPALLAPNGSIKQQHYDQDHSDVKSNSPTCHSPSSILPDLPGCDNGEDSEKLTGLSKDASAIETQAWLACNRFAHHANTFANFSGADLLRLSRDDIIQICGLADGIRLCNCLHAKRMEPRLTLYVCCDGGGSGSGGAGTEPLYSAVYLHTWSAVVLADKLRTAAYHLLASGEVLPVAVISANGIRVRLCDDVVRHLRDGATYRLQRTDRTLLLTPTNNATTK